MADFSSIPLLVAKNLSRSFRNGDTTVSAVREIDLAVEQGEFLGLSGPSGCGKSTLLNMLGLVETPSAGELLFCGVDVANANEQEREGLRKNSIGYVFQAFNLLSTLTVEENVGLPCILIGCSKDEARARARELLSSLGLSQRATAMPAMLSGGEMQRVAIARAIAHKPSLILADEPTGNLDSVAGDAVLALLRQLNSQGVTIIMATHSEVALKSCSRVVRMRDGSLVSR